MLFVQTHLGLYKGKRNVLRFGINDRRNLCFGETIDTVSTNKYTNNFALHCFAVLFICQFYHTRQKAFISTRSDHLVVTLRRRRCDGLSGILYSTLCYYSIIKVDFFFFFFGNFSLKYIYILI